MFTKAEHWDCHQDSSLLAPPDTVLGLWLDFHVCSTCLDPGRTYVLCETRFRDISQGYRRRKPGNYGLAGGGGGGCCQPGCSRHSTPPTSGQCGAGGARSHTLTLDSSRVQRAPLNPPNFHVSCLLAMRGSATQLCFSCKGI